MRFVRGLRLAGTAVGVAALVVVATAAAASIVGTPRADVLRGTSGADRLYGRGGNDRLYGLAGNDVLTGGPGRDRFFCGAGRDVVNIDLGETVAADCEVVRRPATPPPPANPTPTPPPPPPPPPPAPAAVPGQYCGYTGQGPGICLTTTNDGRAVQEFATSAIVDCGDGSRWTFGVRFSGRTVSLARDLSFAFDYSGPLTSGSGQLSDIQATYTIRGTFTTGGQASGTVAIASVAFTYEGTRYSCTQNGVTWSTSKQ